MLTDQWQLQGYQELKGIATIETVKRGTDIPTKGYWIASVPASGPDDPTVKLIASAPDLLWYLSELCEAVDALAKRHGYKRPECLKYANALVRRLK